MMMLCEDSPRGGSPAASAQAGARDEGGHAVVETPPPGGRRADPCSSTREKDDVARRLRTLNADQLRVLTSLCVAEFADEFVMRSCRAWVRKLGLLVTALRDLSTTTGQGDAASPPDAAEEDDVYDHEDAPQVLVKMNRMFATVLRELAH